MPGDEGRLDAWMAAATAEPRSTGVLVDFDGTLSPIVDDPASARPVEGGVEVLSALADRFALVAVVSGRPAGFLAEHLEGAGRTRLFGLYGLERVGPEGIETEPAAQGWRLAVLSAAEQAGEELPAGAVVEPKGLTVTLHYRAVPAAAAQVEGVAAVLAATHGLVAHGGKMSVELRPPLEVDKGTVLAHLSGELANLAYAGDDLGDLPAFEALAGLRAEGRSTLAIAVAGTETPAAVLEAVDICVDGPPGLVALLRELLSSRR